MKAVDVCQMGPGKSHSWEHVVFLRIISQSCEFWGFFPGTQWSQLAQVSFLPRHRLVPCQWLSWLYLENLLLRVAVARCCSVYVMFTAKVLLTAVITVAFGITNQRVRTEAWPTEWLPDYPRQVWNTLKHPEATFDQVWPLLSWCFIQGYQWDIDDLGYFEIYLLCLGGEWPAHPFIRSMMSFSWEAEGWVGWFMLVSYGLLDQCPHLSWPQWLPVVPATCYKAMQLPCPCNWKQWRP